MSSTTLCLFSPSPSLHAPPPCPARFCVSWNRPFQRHFHRRFSCWNSLLSFRRVLALLIPELVSERVDSCLLVGHWGLRDSMVQLSDMDVQNGRVFNRNGDVGCEMFHNTKWYNQRCFLSSEDGYGGERVMGRSAVVVAAVAAAVACAAAGVVVGRRVSSRRKWGRVLGVLKELEEGCDTPGARLKQVVDAVAVEMHAGLASEGGSKLRMLLTFVDNLPSGYWFSWLSHGISKWTYPIDCTTFAFGSCLVGLFLVFTFMIYRDFFVGLPFLICLLMMLVGGLILIVLPLPGEF